MPNPDDSYDPRRGVAYLKRCDPQMRTLIERVGPFRLSVNRSLSPFQALLRAIVYQQLSGHAARAIYARTVSLFPDRRPSAKRLVEMSDEKLRGAGLSRPKIAAVRDLAVKTRNRIVPGRGVLERLPDEEIIARLTEVRGVGRWTVEMLLIFHLGRADVLAGDDLGIRKGLKIAYGMAALPTREQVLRSGEIWRPYRSVASWYLWRANDLK